MRFEDLIRPSHVDAPAGERTSYAFGGGPVVDFTGWSYFGIRCCLRRESTIAELVAGRWIAALPLIFLGETSFGEAHELIENGKFELQFNGVDHGFDGRFTNVVVCEL